MKKICVYNIGKELLIELENNAKIISLDNTESPNAFYLEWYPPEHGKEDPNFIKQIGALKYVCLKLKIPVIIFDRFLSIDNNMKKWLKKYKIKIIEPLVLHSPGSIFLPPYINTKKDLGFFPKREIDLGIIDNDLKNKTSSFEKYFLDFSSLNPDSIVKYKGFDNYYKKDEYTDKNLLYDENINWKDISFTIAISRKSGYKRGFFESYIIDAINNGCVPLLPEEHRFYYAVFKKICILSRNDMLYIIKNMKLVSEEIIYDIFKNIEDHFPEFTIQYFCDKILKMF